MEVPITKEMFISVSLAHQRYEEDLEAKRQLKKKEEVEKCTDKSNDKDICDVLTTELKTIDDALQQIDSSYLIADESVSEGNSEFKGLLTKKNSTKKDLQRAQSKIEMGMKRRQELKSEEYVLTKRKKEIEHELSAKK